MLSLSFFPIFLLSTLLLTDKKRNHNYQADWDGDTEERAKNKNEKNSGFKVFANQKRERRIN